MRENQGLDFHTLVQHTEAEIEALVYTPIGTKAPQPLMMAYYSSIKWLREWNLHLVNANGGYWLTDEQWGEIDPREYDKFIMLKQIRQLLITAKPPPSPPTKVVDPVADSKKGSNMVHPFIQSSGSEALEQLEPFCDSPRMCT